MDDESKKAIEAVHSWERRLLIVAFTGWAAVVAAYGQAAINRIDKIVETQARERDLNSDVHASMDRRLTITEQNDKVISRQLDKIEAYIDSERRYNADKR